MPDNNMQSVCVLTLTLIVMITNACLKDDTTKETVKVRNFIKNSRLAHWLSRRGQKTYFDSNERCNAVATVTYPRLNVDPLEFSCTRPTVPAEPPVCKNKENTGQVIFSVNCKVNAT